MVHKLRRYLITGFVVVVPIYLTIYILLVLFRFFDGILGKYINIYLKDYLGFNIPGIGILISLIIIILTGFLVTRFIGQKIFPHLERWFANLPLINKIYPNMKQIVMFVLAQKEFGFKKVVLVEYPSKGIFSIGFITNEQFKKMDEASGRELAAVFVPTTPSPFTGYVVFIPKEELKLINMPVGDALKIIISGGVVKP